MRRRYLKERRFAWKVRFGEGIGVGDSVVGEMENWEMNGGVWNFMAVVEPFVGVCVKEVKAV